MENLICDFYQQAAAEGSTGDSKKRHWQISTPRLLLRSWQESDREPFAAMGLDSEVMEFFPAPLSREESDALISRINGGFDERGWGLWAVEVKNSSGVDRERAESTDRDSIETVSGFIGYVGLAIPRFEAHFTPCVEVGWRLRRSAWGHGFATEAAAAAIQFGFTQLKLDQIVSMTATLNLRSQQVMQRLGMQSDSAEDFDHPLVEPNHRLCRHVLYRLNNPSIDRA